MFFIYNIVQLLVICCLWPLLAVMIAALPKYRGHIARRLGWGLSRALGSPLPRKKTIWVHALSVGELTSALPLIKGIRDDLDVNLIFSVTTRSGARLAQTCIAPYVDRVLPFPIDLLPVVRRFLTTVRPDLFILVETDFWPNLLASLQRRNIPALLVNGRISKKSMASYRRFGWFFRPLFRSFAALCMQTAKDKEYMIGMGVAGGKVFTLGNLKFDTSPAPVAAAPLPEAPGLRIVAGSTHPGEEEGVFLAYKKLTASGRDLSLLLAPRDITRGGEIQRLARSLGLEAVCRSEGTSASRPAVLILDTLGELAAWYQHCDIAFVGGSLVDQGGHNPIEPAVHGVPVLFGPHMEDFAEIAEGLLVAGGAIRVRNADSLFQSLERLLGDPAARRRAGAAAGSYILEQQGVIKKHLQLIRDLL